jgi:hypothetical protein
MVSLEGEKNCSERGNECAGGVEGLYLSFILLSSYKLYFLLELDNKIESDFELSIKQKPLKVLSLRGFV